jgi:DNA replicative helicase MCM subunit Mcm2 (Cdc46/Mcm family)
VTARALETLIRLATAHAKVGITNLLNSEDIPMLISVHLCSGQVKQAGREAGC